MTNGRYYGLDALRGIAAIAVAFFHSRSGIAANGFLAVDIFFLMSGFILCKVYEPRLINQMSFRTFIERRIARLFPVYLIGAYLSIARDGNVFAIFMVPQLSGEGYFFPGNVPLWSLPFEFLASIVFACFLVRLSNLQLAGFFVLSGAIWAIATIETGVLNSGDRWETGLLGMARLFFGFSMGMLIARVSGERKYSILTWLVLGAVALFLFLNYHDRYIVVFCVLAVFPIILYTLAKMELPRSSQTVAKWLGNLSYPLYAVHIPILHWTMHIIGPFGSVFLSLGVAGLVYALVDKPGQRILSNMFNKRKSDS